MGVDYTLSQLNVVNISLLTDDNVVSEAHIIFYHIELRYVPADCPIFRIFTFVYDY